MATTSGAIFTGSSQFSKDFQSVLERSVKIAALPILQLNSQLTALDGQSTALAGLDLKFTALGTALTSVQDAVTGGSFDAVISDPDLVNVALGNGVIEGNYSIDVLDAGAYSTSLTSVTWVNTPNAPGTTHTFELWIDGVEQDITPDDNSAQTLANAINAAAGSRARAIAVNVGSTDAPDWRISLQSVSLGNIPLDIKDGGVSLQTQTAGREAQYIVNQSGHTASSDSRTLTIANGLTVLLKTSDPGNPVNITVTRSSSALSTALAGFADAYNAAVDTLDQQRGNAQGALAGNSVLYGLGQALTAMATYSPDGSQFSGLKDLGLSLGSDGRLTFIPFVLLGADFAASAGITEFFGSTTGGGFLKAAALALDSVENSSTGILTNAASGVQSEISATNRRVELKQAQVDQLEERLQRQMAVADAAIASMEQRYSFLRGMFEAMQTASKQYS